MRWLIIISFLFFASCMDSLEMNYRKVREIKIIRIRDSSTIILTDREAFSGVVQYCLDEAHEQSSEVVPSYRMDVKEIDTSYSIYIDGRYLIRGGIIYRSDCNPEHEMEKLFKKYAR